MAVKLHSSVSGGARHPIHQLTYPDAANRVAGTNEGTGATPKDFDVAKQDDDDSLWILLDAAIPTWRQIAGNSLAISGDLTLGGKLTLTDTVWDDLRVPLGAFKAGALADPDWVKLTDNGAASQGLYAWHFDQNTEEELFFAAQMPHGWKLGTTIQPHVHWMPTSTNTGNVIWGLEYAVIELAGVLGNSDIVYATQAGSGTARQHHRADMTAISMSGIATLSPVITCRIFRNAAADSYTADAALLEFDFHYEIDTMGSDEPLVK